MTLILGTIVIAIVYLTNGTLIVDSAQLIVELALVHQIFIVIHALMLIMNTTFQGMFVWKIVEMVEIWDIMNAMIVILLMEMDVLKIVKLNLVIHVREEL